MASSLSLLAQYDSESGNDSGDDDPMLISPTGSDEKSMKITAQMNVTETSSAPEDFESLFNNYDSNRKVDQSIPFKYNLASKKNANFMVDSPSNITATGQKPADKGNSLVGTKRKIDDTKLVSYDNKLTFRPPQLVKPNVSTEDMKSWTSRK